MILIQNHSVPTPTGGITKLYKYNYLLFIKIGNKNSTPEFERKLIEDLKSDDTIDKLLSSFCKCKKVSDNNIAYINDNKESMRIYLREKLIEYIRAGYADMTTTKKIANYTYNILLKEVKKHTND